MSMHDRSAVMLSRSVDESSVVLTATVTPPEAASNLQWSKTGEGFDIVPSGTSCTVNGNNSFEGYDAHGQVTAKVDTSGAFIGSQDTCDVSVVKDKGNLINNEDFSTTTSHGITVQRVIANKYSVSGTCDSGQVAVDLATVPLQEGVYSLGKSDYSHLVTSGSGKLQVQVYVSGGGHLVGSGNAALVDASYRVNLITSFANQGDTFSGYVVPFLSKVPDSGQLIEGHDLSANAEDWVTTNATVDFVDTDAVVSATSHDSRIHLDPRLFSHERGNVYAVFLDAYSDDLPSIRIGPFNGTIDVNITSSKKRYGVLYTASENTALSIFTNSAGTLHVSNVKLVRITDTSSFNSFATLDEPRIEPLFL